MQEKIKCLYYIKDKRTDKIIYIGFTTNFSMRKNEHFGRSGEDEQPIDNYMFNEGRENFSMEIFKDIDVKDCNIKELREKEQYLIEYHNTIENGFNKHRSGNIAENFKSYQAQWYMENREYKLNKSKDYQKINRQKKAEYMREYRLRKKLNITK